MAELKDRIDNSLNEARMLLLGGQVLLGVAFRVYFEPGFQRLPGNAQLLQTLSLFILTVTLGLLIWPAPFHQIAIRGEESARLDRFTSAVMDWALFPFALGTGMSLYPIAVAMRVPPAGVLATMSSAFALSLWYAVSLGSTAVKRDRVQKDLPKQEDEKKKRGENDIGERVKTVLIECRMALPGAQALLGFQFINVFTDAFEKLPRLLQWVHFGSLLSTLITTMLLIAPAAYHRLAEGGEETEHFHRVASRFLLLALVFLAPGMAGDVVVVFSKISGSITLGLAVSGAMLILFYGFWFGYSVWARRSAS